MPHAELAMCASGPPSYARIHTSGVVMMIRSRWSVLLGVLLAAPVTAQQPAPSSLAPHQRLAREVYRELIEINTADSVGSVTRAAEAMARRFRDAGFPARDVHLLVPAGEAAEGTLVVRYRGRGGPSAGKPILLLAHLDV